MHWPQSCRCHRQQTSWDDCECDLQQRTLQVGHHQLGPQCHVPHTGYQNETRSAPSDPPIDNTTTTALNNTSFTMILNYIFWYTSCLPVPANNRPINKQAIPSVGQDRYPKLALEGYVHGQKGRGRPKKRWLYVVSSDCADMGLTVHDAIHLAQDRDAWRRSIAKLPLRAPAGASPRH